MTVEEATETPQGEPAANSQAAGEVAAPVPASSTVEPVQQPAVETPSLLSTATDNAPVKDDVPAPEAPKPDETPPVPEPLASPEPIAYDPFTFPETFAPDAGELSRFTELLAEYHAPQDLGQKLVDFYTGEIGRMETAQREVWDRTQAEWQDTVRKDAEIGGNRFQTTLDACGRVLDEFGTPALREVLTATGAGNHPEVIRFVNKVARFMSEGRPIPAQVAPAAPQSKAARRYNRPNGVA